MGNDYKTQTVEFIRRIEGLRHVLPDLAVMLQISAKTHGQTRQNYLETHGTPKTSEQKTTYSLPLDKHATFHMLDQTYRHLSEAKSLLPPMFLVALVSQFDAHVGRLMRLVYMEHQEKMRTSRRRINYSTLENFSTVQEAKDYLIERQIEGVLRKNHSHHFEWMERMLGCKLTKDLAPWPHFIELTERRNLFVHCDGVVSHQYLNICKLHSSQLDPDIKAGSRLLCPQKYFERAYRTLYEIGVKLAQVIWRRCSPKDLVGADDALNTICYDLICSKEYLIAIPLLEFAIAPTTTTSSADRKGMSQMNLAQAYKWNNQLDKCIAVLGSVDWSDKEDKFKLGHAVLSNDFDSAETIMKRIGKNGSIEKVYYRDWPIFTEFRESEQFKRAFRELFSEEFATLAVKAEAPTAGPPEANVKLPHADN